jgi:hypothetical protein
MAGNPHDFENEYDDDEKQCVGVVKGLQGKARLCANPGKIQPCGSAYACHLHDAEHQSDCRECRLVDR